VVGIYAALIGAAVALLLRVAWEVPEDLRQHDRRMKEFDEDLETWVVDDNSDLLTELQEIDNDHAGRGVFDSSFRITARNRARARALLRYRNEESRAHRAANELRASEGAIHRLYRALARRPFRTLEGPDRVQPVLDRWRTTDGNGKPGGFPDPSRLTLDNLLRTHPSRNPWY
jgi:hypothetical protein